MELKSSEKNSLPKPEQGARGATNAARFPALLHPLNIEEQLEFSDLLSKLSTRFVNIPASEVDDQIEAALEQVLDFFQVDRCGLLGISPARKRIHVTHAAYAEGIDRISGDIDLARLFPWSHERLVMKGEYVSVSRMADLPPEAEKDRQSWTAMGVRSSLVIPLFFKGSVSSLFVIGSLRRHHSWSAEYIPRLRLLGEIFINALDRRNSDRALRESEERLSLAVDAAETGLWSLDLSTNIFWMTDKSREIYGFAPGEEISLDRVIRTIHPDDRYPVRQIAERAIRSRETARAYYRIALGDGSVKWIASRGRPFFHASGAPARLMGVSVDVTAQKTLEEDLQASEEKFRQFFKNTPDYCYIISPEGTILNVNNAALQRLGYEREQLVGKPLAMIYAPESVPRMKELFAEWKETGQIRNEEMDIVTKNGERRTVLLHVGSVRDQDGAILFSTSVQTDITERKRVEKALEESQVQALAVVNSTDDLIWSVDPERFGLLTWNRAFRDYFFKRRGIEIAVGMTPVELVPPDYVALWHEMFSRALHEGSFSTEYVVAQTNVLLLSLNHLKRGGEVFGISVFGRDITERKKAEEALMESESALRNSQTDLRKLAGRLISAQEEELRRLARELHDDLTQKLAALAIDAGKLELELNKDPQPLSSHALKVRQIKDNLIKVSEDVHNISRQLHPSILDDLGLVRAIESECAILLKQEDVQITFIKENVPPRLPKDIALCLYRVVQESLRNVTQHSQAKSTEIFLEGSNSKIRLTIKDAGIGFDPSEVRHKPGLGLASMRER
ncbi:MAG: PAS domain S-box protein, partial [Deltaproteobacteria bacterium]